MKTHAGHDEQAAGTPACLPSTAQLLTAGGDARIALDAVTGLNAYGCSPYPEPELLAYGSSTASVISPEGYGYAQRMRQRLLHALGSASAATVYALELRRIRAELRDLCALPDNTEIIFSPSGTDAHSVAAQYTGSGTTSPARIVMIDANETGRGVRAALDGSRLTVASGHPAPEIVAVSVRLADGSTRPATDIDADVSELVSIAAKANRRVLLILVDQSKTGLLAPSLHCVLALQRQYPHNIDMLVDACQFRIAQPTLRAYLQQGFIVALTGSKFLSGPSFSAALLVPPQTAHQLALRPFPNALSASSSKSDWPANWTTTAHDAQTSAFGLLLRWEIAAQELRAFRAIPLALTIGIIKDFTAAILQRLHNNPHFKPLAVPALDRRPLLTDDSWDHLQTIFPFLLYHADAGRKPLSMEETMLVYRQLPTTLDSYQGNTATRCQLGQPVACGKRDGIMVSALRLCISTRLIVQAVADKDGGLRVITGALAALDKTALLIRSLPTTDFHH
ncbi:MAG: hypothetical protein Q7U57_14835 [Methylovulum sp.]|nr:hypothetical protein [Methylovulum sp.]